MGRAMTMTVRLSGPLSEFVAANVGETGDYESVSEYVRDLIRCGTRPARSSEAFDRLKAELERAFAAPDYIYYALSAADVIERSRRRSGA